jgi:tetratricopeptide (TPR) repeat protein
MDDDSPAAQADQILEEAFEEQNPRRRVQLARKALEIDPDCVDAYVLLAENAPDRKEALALYEQGVAAGERRLGPAYFQQNAGHFWGLLETRPYMRAREGLATALWTAGRRDEAIKHEQEMLRLNPGDNQGIRYSLAANLLREDRDAELEQLFQQFPDEGSTMWAYTRALAAFRKEGDGAEAPKLLGEAKKKNRYVPDYLLGHKFPPMEQPPYYSMGDESEAIVYAQMFLSAWKNTVGAIAWLRANEKPQKKEQAPRPKGPLAMIKKWLKQHLPQEEDIWEADYRQLPISVGPPDEASRPWLFLVASRSQEDLMHIPTVLEAEPSPNLLWDKLVQAMQEPRTGEPHRPTEIRVRSAGAWESLRAPLDEIGVDLVIRDDLEMMDPLFEDLLENAFGKPRPALLDVPGIGPEQAAGFYDAAAFYFQEAPWRRVGYEAAIKVECTKFHSGPWYAVIMGQSGLTIGLALYEDLEILRTLWSETASDEENARMSVSTTVLYGEENEIPAGDLEAARRYGWKVARPDAYPGVFHKERGMAFRPPLAWELELMEGCLRAIPEFVKRHRQDDPAVEAMTVPTASGELHLTLSWVTEETG